MTDRVRTLTIQLDDDYRVDDVEYIVNAIRMVKGVNKVELGAPVDIADWSARMTIGMEYRQAIWDAIDKVTKGKR